MNLTQLQQQEFARIYKAGHTYVDYTGGGQAPQSVLDRYHELVSTTVFGNPHSYNPTSKHTTELIEAVRKQVLAFVGAGNDYEVVFTNNASGALKIVGESYPWSDQSVLVLSRDNHNSVLGMREFAKRAGATIVYWELTEELRLQDNLAELIKQYPGKQVVVAFPAQSNFSGVMHPLEFVELAHSLGAEVILDSAAFVPSHAMDLQAIDTPEAICVSFYKVLGFPTGLGALIVRKDFLAKLRKPWFAGGTVRGVSLEDHVLEAGFERFEDGTINYALIPALSFVFEWIESIGGVGVIEEHNSKLTAQALMALNQMSHVTIYGPRTTEQRGATIALNMVGKDGNILHYEQVEKLAYEQGISLRGGCFCNPGSGSRAFELDGLAMQKYLKELQSHSKSEVGVPGAVRISFGIGNTEQDIEKTVDFIAGLEG